MSMSGNTRRHALALLAGATGMLGIRAKACGTALPKESTQPESIGLADRRSPDQVGSGVQRTPFVDGAKGDGRSDDGAALRRMVLSCGASGGAISLPAGQFQAGAASGQVLLLTAPIALTGASASLSVINPDFAQDNDDTIVLSPSPDVSHEGLIIRDIGLLDPTNGRRKGRRGIFLKTDNVGQQLPSVWLTGLSIGAGTGAQPWGIHHRNVPGANGNGGWYGGGVARCIVRGGIFLENSGDSLHVDDNILSGSGRSLKVGLISGASCLTVRGNNMTSAGGAIDHVSGHRCSYEHNNIEHFTDGIESDADGHRAVVSLFCATAPGVGNRLIGGLISCYGKSNANVLVKIENQRGFVLDGVTLLVGLRGITAIYIGALSRDTVIGQLIGQDSNDDGIIDLIIVDHGIGTMGITKNAALTGDWLASEHDTPLQYRKSPDGTVRLWGTIKPRKSRTETTVTVLPPGFRPHQIVQSPVLIVNKYQSQSQQGLITIASDGNMIVTSPASTEMAIIIDTRFEAMNAGHSISME